MDKFDKLNRETFEYNNGISRKISWYDVTTNNGYSWKKPTEKTGRYLGNGQYVED